MKDSCKTQTTLVVYYAATWTTFKPKLKKI